MHVLYSTVRPLDRNQLFSIIHAFIKNAQTKTTTARRKENVKENSEKNREWKGSRSSALSSASFDVK